MICKHCKYFDDNNCEWFEMQNAPPWATEYSCHAITGESYELQGIEECPAYEPRGDDNDM